MSPTNLFSSAIGGERRLEAAGDASNSLSLSPPIPATSYPVSSDDAARLKAEILRLAAEFSRLSHSANRPGYEQNGSNPFLPGSSVVPYAGRVFAEEEVTAAVSATLDFWLTLGKEGEEFEKGLASLNSVTRAMAAN